VTTELRYLAPTESSWSDEADVVVVGTGAAGLAAALAARRRGRRVLLVCKAAPHGGSTPLAQGGLAAVMDPLDSIDSHFCDTVNAAAGLARESAVLELVKGAPDAVRALEQLGARFDRGRLGLEGGHSQRRIVHAGGDASGVEVHRTLLRAVRDANITILEGTVAIDALLDGSRRVIGLRAGRVGATPGDPLQVGYLSTAALVLATGGFGQAYATTSNPVEITGDGLALAARAGAAITDVEFVQFHPTVLFQEGRRGQCPLVTEALRGAGGVIIDVDGASVMAGVHPLGDLAPRDVVAAAMQRVMAAGVGPTTHVWLDARSLGTDRLERDFPTVTSICRSVGIDPAREPIPVAPGAHYSCGGVRADMEGRTSVAGLYAVGEVAATGVHGANRLASNSLTEALITGERLGRQLAGGDQGDGRPVGRTTEPAHSGAGVDAAQRDELATMMSLHAGVLRSANGLELLRCRLGESREGPSSALDLATLEATNLHTVSTMVVRAALWRQESRGCHRRNDFDRVRSEWERRIEQIGIDGRFDMRVKSLQ
jgi:L-aspartate oxidase